MLKQLKNRVRRNRKESEKKTNKEKATLQFSAIIQFSAKELDRKWVKKHHWQSNKTENEIDNIQHSAYRSLGKIIHFMELYSLLLIFNILHKCKHASVTLYIFFHSFWLLFFLILSGVSSCLFFPLFPLAICVRRACYSLREMRFIFVLLLNFNFCICLWVLYKKSSLLHCKATLTATKSSKSKIKCERIKIRNSNNAKKWYNSRNVRNESSSSNVGAEFISIKPFCWLFMPKSEWYVLCCAETSIILTETRSYPNTQQYTGM